MIKSVSFYSIDWFRHKISPNTSAIAISVLSQDEWESVKSLPKGYAGHIKLCFADLYEEKVPGLTENWADLSDRHSEGVRLFYKGYELCDLNDAKKSLRFIDHYANKVEGYDLIVHCHGGVSRSAALAKFVSDKYAAPITNTNPDTSCANLRFLRLLNKAWILSNN